MIMKKFAVVLSCLVVLFFLSCAQKPVVHDVTKAVDTANKVLKNLMAGNYGDAYKYFTDEFKNQIDADAFAGSCGKNAGMLGKWKKAEFKYYIDPKGKPDIELIYSCDFTKGVEYPMHIILTWFPDKGYEVGVLDYGYNFHPEAKGAEVTKMTIKDKVVLKP